jgi:hypothetical protein
LVGEDKETSLFLGWNLLESIEILRFSSAHITQRANDGNCGEKAGNMLPWILQIMSGPPDLTRQRHSNGQNALHAAREHKGSPIQDIARDDAITAIRFPIRLLTLVCLLTIVAFAWFGWILFDVGRDAKMFTGQLSRIEELRGVIVHLDEVLTTSARMAAATGDPKWEQRYRRFEPQLDAAIKETTEFAS